MRIEPGATVIFLGPSLALQDAKALLHAVYLPPVQQGDLYRAALARPRVIAVIDGYFAWVPSVWHKEILWAIQEGIRVYGASSMGALRAAELDAFGMLGHGQVYRAYADGLLEDDDEVAVTHAVSELGFQPLSDAMVNIRQTLADATAAGCTSSGQAGAMVAHFKRLHFPERSLLAGLDHPELDAWLPRGRRENLRAWLQMHQRDVKREDACSLLALLALGEAGFKACPLPNFELQATLNWSQLASTVHGQIAADEVSLQPDDDAVPNGQDELLLEVQLLGGWPELEAQCLARLVVMGAATAATETLSISEAEYIDQLARVALRLGLDDAQSLMHWAASVGWTPEYLSEVVVREARLERARTYARSDLRRVAHDLLQLNGRAQPLLARARDKRLWLESRPAYTMSVSDVEARALAWFRQSRANTHLDGAELARCHGWPSLADMEQDVLHEFLYREDVAA